MSFCFPRNLLCQKHQDLWINHKVDPFNLAFATVLQSQVLTIGRDENNFSYSKVVIGKVLNSFKAKFIFGIASE